MKKTQLSIRIVLIGLCITIAACSKKGSYAQLNYSKQNGHYFLPYQVIVVGDSVASIGFMQSQMIYYMSLRAPKSANNLKNLQQAYKNLTLVLVKMDPADPHRIIEAEPAPSELSRRFRQSLHTDSAKHRIN